MAKKINTGSNPLFGGLGVPKTGKDMDTDMDMEKSTDASADTHTTTDTEPSTVPPTVPSTEKDTILDKLLTPQEAYVRHTVYLNEEQSEFVKGTAASRDVKQSEIVRIAVDMLMEAMKE